MKVFLLLLAAFMLAILFYYHVSLDWLALEGFISYNQSAAMLNQIVIPQYSAQTVYKMYDSLYFDNMNGNVIELFGTPYTNPVSDTVGASLTHLTLMSRASTPIPNSKNVRATATQVDLSGVSQMVDQTLIPATVDLNYRGWVYPTQLDMAAITQNVPTYQVLYFPCGTDTLIHVYNFRQQNHVGTYLFRQHGDPGHVLPSTQITMPKTYVSDRQPNNVYVNDTDYCHGRPLCRVSDYVYFDPRNRYLVLKDTDNTFMVYNGMSQADGTAVAILQKASRIPEVPDVLPSLPFGTLYIPEPAGNNVVLYIPFSSSSKTLVVVLCCDPNNNEMYSVKNSVLFNPDISSGVEGISGVLAPVYPSTTTNATDISYNPVIDTLSTTVTDNRMFHGTDEIPSLEQTISDYYATYFGGTAGTARGTTPNLGNYSEDFLRKTQIVPPVCPTCPNCPSQCLLSQPSQSTNVTCTNCGGHGGSGTLNSSGKTVIDSSNNRLDNDVMGGIETVSKDGHRLSNDVLSGIESVGSGVGNAGKRLSNDILGAGETLGRDVHSALAFHPTTISQNTSNTSNTTTIVPNATSGASSGSNNTNSYTSVQPRTSASTASTASIGPDWMSYYGALPESHNSSNYIPITSDFSQFGR